MKKDLLHLGMLLVGLALWNAFNPWLMLDASLTMNYIVDLIGLSTGITFMAVSDAMKDTDKERIKQLNGTIEILNNQRHRQIIELCDFDVRLMSSKHNNRMLKAEANDQRLLINSLEFDLKEANRELFSLRGNFAQSKKRYKQAKIGLSAFIKAEKFGVN